MLAQKENFYISGRKLDTLFTGEIPCPTFSFTFLPGRFNISTSLMCILLHGQTTIGQREKATLIWLDKLPGNYYVHEIRKGNEERNTRCIIPIFIQKVWEPFTDHNALFTVEIVNIRRKLLHFPCVWSFVQVGQCPELHISTLRQR